MSELKTLCFYEYDKQIAVAFKWDCQEFLEEFAQLRSLKFTDFAAIWRSKSFTYVFAGQKYALLLRELCENCFYIVKKFFMFPSSIYIQVGAFYLLYGLYYKQPLDAWVKVRLTLEEYKKMTALVEDMKSRGMYDVVYIFTRMKTDQAFVYTAVQRPLGPEDRFIKGYQRFLDFTFNSSRGEDTLLKFKETVRNDSLLKDLETTSNEYQELMAKYAEKCPSLVSFPSTILADLREACSEMESEGSGSFPIKQEDEGAAAKGALRAKAMSSKNAVYRGNRKVKRGVDLETRGDENRDSDNENIDTSDVDM